MNWISAKERLPEIASIVILSIQHPGGNTSATGFRANGGWYVFRIGNDPKQFIPNGIEDVTVTHWQTLPNRVVADTVIASDQN